MKILWNIWTYSCLLTLIIYSVISQEYDVSDYEVNDPISDDDDDDRVNMGQNEFVEPADFQSPSFPNQPGIDPFSRQNQFDLDPFRTQTSSTENPFRAARPPSTTTTTERNYNNQNQNNGFRQFQPVQPNDPYQRNYYNNQNRGQQQSTGISQTDEYGNLLDKIQYISNTHSEYGQGVEEDEKRCPRSWVRGNRQSNRDSCYKFVRSPDKRWSDARLQCQAYRHQDKDNSDLASVNSLEEHEFITNHLNKIDPQHRRWYLSARQEGQKTWRNHDKDQSIMANLEKYFLESKEWGEGYGQNYKKEHLVYDYSIEEQRWGFRPVFGHEEYLYICEMPITQVNYLLVDDRTHQYGQPLGDPRFLKMGPYIIRQPNNTVFNVATRKIKNEVRLRCDAMGFPTPKYKWFREKYRNDELVEEEVNPLDMDEYGKPNNTRVTISGGTLIINDPHTVTDRGRYFCKAYNELNGRKHEIRSQSVSIAFGFIGEFILRRTDEFGSENWGKAISCDPPQYFPDVKFYWARDYFPNFVEEDRRVMVSYDGNLYFSSLEKIDQGNYSCSVQSSVSSNGRNGPFFHLKVTPHPNWQQLRFPQNFPKAFPEAPVAGEDVRLECIAFGYPVPYYNWTRKNSNIPRDAVITNHNRVLLLPRVKVEDQGEYECRAHNDKVSITGTVTLSIQSRPVFTISIGDRHVYEKDDITWTCEAFGIPDVKYDWLKNGRKLSDQEKLESWERQRYEIKDNILIIRGVNRVEDSGMFQCMAFNELDVRYSSGQLRVLELFAPTFEKYPLEKKTYAAIGGNVTLRCRPEGAPQPKFTWRKDGNVIGKGGKYIQTENGNLFISRINRDDGGSYTCEADNEMGKDESSGYLFVTEGPSFNRNEGGTTPKEYTIAIRNKDVPLQCKAVAAPLLDMAYIWTFNGLTIRFFEDEEKERQLLNKNAHGNRLSENTFYKQLSEHERLFNTAKWNKGSNFYLDDYASGTGNYNQYKRGQKEGYLEIVNITYAETGTYECVVDTAVGKIKTTTNVIVHGPPGPPGGVSAVSLTSKSGTLIWTDGAIYGAEICFYRIEGRTQHNSTWVVLADMVQAENHELGDGIVIHGRREFFLNNKLSPYSSYEFRVAAYNKYSFPDTLACPTYYDANDPYNSLRQTILGEYSEPSPRYNTAPGPPEKAPMNVRGGGGITGDLTIEWDPLPRQDQNGPGVYYRIYYRRIGVDAERDFQQQTLKQLGNMGNRGFYVVKIQKKYYWTQHEVKVQVFNDLCLHQNCTVAPTSNSSHCAKNVTSLNRNMPSGNGCIIYSAEDLPQVAPTRVGARPFNSTAIKITWNALPSAREKIRGELIGYRIKYWREDLNEITESQYLLSRSTENHALIIGLQPNAYYWVRVMAYNQAGPGPESERFQERTFKLRPQKPPTAVQVYGINPSTVRVTWRYVAPSVDEEPLTGYKVRYWESDKDISVANDTTVYIGRNLETIIDDLSPGKTYFLRVLAFSQGGEGKMSSPAWQFQMGDPKVLNTALGLSAVKFWTICAPLVLTLILWPF